MKNRYHVVIEFDPESGHYTATVPGLPEIFADAKSEAAALRLAKEGITMYLEENSVARSAGRQLHQRPLHAKVVTVEV